MNKISGLRPFEMTKWENLRPFEMANSEGRTINFLWRKDYIAA
jgi:hypothetical protein